VSLKIEAAGEVGPSEEGMCSVIRQGKCVKGFISAIIFFRFISSSCKVYHAVRINGGFTTGNKLSIFVETLALIVVGFSTEF